MEKVRQLNALYEALAKRLGISFLDASQCQINTMDHLHLTRIGHMQLAEQVASYLKAHPTILA